VIRPLIGEPGDGAADGGEQAVLDRADLASGDAAGRADGV
jgi:hypothetical protein